MLRLIHMKRTNLVLDEHLLEEAKRLCGDSTYSATVNRALQDFIRRAHAGNILELAGSGLWQGDLAAMRGDTDAAPPAPPRRRRGARP
jgi:Arc/MetJ family transcription regulator